MSWFKELFKWGHIATQRSILQSLQRKDSFSKHCTLVLKSETVCELVSAPAEAPLSFHFQGNFPLEIYWNAFPIFHNFLLLSRQTEQDVFNTETMQSRLNSKLREEGLENIGKYFLGFWLKVHE